MDIGSFIREKKFVLSSGVILLIILYVLYAVVGTGGEAPIARQVERPKIRSAVNLQEKNVEINLATNREIPREVPLYKIKKPPDALSAATKLASKFGFFGKPESKGVYQWLGKNRSLEIQKNLSIIDYKDFSVKPAKKGLKEVNILAKAKEFLKKRGLLSENLEVGKKIEYLVSSPTHFGHVDSFQKSNYIQVYFNRRLGDYFVFGASPVDQLVTVTLNKKGEVFNLTYKGFEVEEESTYKIRSVSEASKRIKTEGIVVTVLSGRGEGRITLGAFEDILVEDYFLAYLQEQGNSYIQPIYVFRGRGFAGVVEMDVFIYVTALERVGG